MINRVELKNFGPIENLDWQNLGKINLIIGNNDCGKSFLLKALYSAMRTLEDYKRGDNQDTAAEILVKKLYWTFQAEKIGDLVNKQANSVLSFSLELDNSVFTYSFGKGATKTIATVDNHVLPRTANSIFLPAKEVLSPYDVIYESREVGFKFGFDDTYFDLVKALQIPAKPPLKFNESKLDGKSIVSNTAFIKSRKQLENMIGGKIELDDVSKRWYFKKGKQRFPMGVTAEGVKKIGILETLLGNRYLNQDSIIFVDEPESTLHPEMITKFLDIISLLAQQGIQFFIASHSYFVVKKLFLIAQEQQLSIPVLSYQDNQWLESNLLDDMPDNPIIDESIRLYKEEMFLASH